MHLGLFIAGEGHHIAAWRDQSTRKLSVEDIVCDIKLARN